MTLPVPVESVRRHDWLLDQVPAAATDHGFLARFLRIFQTLGDTVLERVDGLEHLLEPEVAPLPVVRYLASWLDLGIVDPTLDEDQQRRLVRSAGDALGWRGTRRGLESFLHMVCTGDDITVDDHGWVARARDIGDPGDLDGVEDPRALRGAGGHVDIAVPDTGWLSDEDFLVVLGEEVPAEVTFTVTVAGRRTWPTEEAP